MWPFKKREAEQENANAIKIDFNFTGQDNNPNHVQSIASVVIVNGKVDTNKTVVTFTDDNGKETTAGHLALANVSPFKLSGNNINVEALTSVFPEAKNVIERANNSIAHAVNTAKELEKAPQQQLTQEVALAKEVSQAPVVAKVEEKKLTQDELFAQILNQDTKDLNLSSSNKGGFGKVNSNERSV